MSEPKKTAEDLASYIYSKFFGYASRCEVERIIAEEIRSRDAEVSKLESKLAEALKALEFYKDQDEWREAPNSVAGAALEKFKKEGEKA